MGPPKKYATAEEANAARRERNRQQMAQRRGAVVVVVSAPEPRFIAYAPTPSDVPTITPPNLQLRSDVVGTPCPIITPPATQSQGPGLTTPLALQAPAFFLQEEDNDVLVLRSSSRHPNYTISIAQSVGSLGDRPGEDAGVCLILPSQSQKVRVQPGVRFTRLLSEKEEVERHRLHRC
jgi:hypothetical protein